MPAVVARACLRLRPGGTSYALLVAYLLGVLALLVSVAALVISLRGGRRTTAPSLTDTDLPLDTAALRAEVAALQLELGQSLRHLSVVRYDAFDDMGGELSWSLVLVDDSGSGILISAINGRQHGRTYAKSLSRWEYSGLLSPEEESAIAAVRP